MSVKVYTIDISGTNSPLDGEHECNGAGLNWGEGFVSGIPFHGFPHPILDNKWHKIEYNHLTGEWAIDKPDEVSDDFLYFCQHGKYPEPSIDPDAEAKEENQYIHELKKHFKRQIYFADCSMLTHDDGCPSDHLNVYALLELAREIAPNYEFMSDAYDEVMYQFEVDPQSVIDNMPR